MSQLFLDKTHTPASLHKLFNALLVMLNKRKILEKSGDKVVSIRSRQQSQDLLFLAQYQALMSAAIPYFRSFKPIDRTDYDQFKCQIDNVRNDVKEQVKTENQRKKKQEAVFNAQSTTREDHGQKQQGSITEKADDLDDLIIHMTIDAIHKLSEPDLHSALHAVQQFEGELGSSIINDFQSEIPEKQLKLQAELPFQKKQQLSSLQELKMVIENELRQRYAKANAPRPGNA